MQHDSVEASGGVNRPLAAVLQAPLASPENALAILPVDVDTQMRFADGQLVITEGHLWARHHENEDWSIWALSPDLQLQVADHAGLGTVTLLSPEERLGRWHFTMGSQAQASHLVQTFERQKQRVSQTSDALGGMPQALSPHGLCPQCHAPLQAAGADCMHCAKEQNAEASTWVLLRLRRFARPYRWQLAIGLLLMLTSTAASLVPPYLTIPLMDDILIPFQSGQPIDTDKVLLCLGGLLLSALVAWGLGWARTYMMALVSERIGADLRTTTYQHLMRLSLDYFGSKRTGDLMARIGSETDRINLFLSLHALDFVTDVLMILMTAVILFSINPWLALVTLLPLPFIGWMINAVRTKLRSGFDKAGRVWSEVTNVLADTIPGVRVVKAFAQEAHETGRFRRANDHNTEVNDRINRTWSLFSPTVSLLTEIGLLVVWAFGIWLVTREQITVGVLAAFIAYIGRFYTRLDSMSRIVSITQNAAAAAKRLFDILDHVSTVPDPVQPVKLAKVKGQIQLHDVGFRYGTRSVIKGLNLEIRPGEMIGLVGHSGSGKSTLVNLICRFYDVTEGSITLDGEDLRRFAVSDYRRHIGLVLQEPFLFFGSIAENIAYGRPDATRAEIIAAARAAHAHDFILRLPHGYDSLVGERGQGLSGGERQRISIARALLIDPKILILDEATSAVDTETEKEIQKALDNLVQGRTTIAIAHRLSTLRKADRLVVMDRGEIVEVGPHDALIEARGTYWRLYDAQVRRAEEDAEAAGVRIETFGRLPVVDKGSE